MYNDDCYPFRQSGRDAIPRLNSEFQHVHAVELMIVTIDAWTIGAKAGFDVGEVREHV